MLSHTGGLLFLSTTSNSTSTSANEGGVPLSEALTLSRYFSRYWQNIRAVKLPGHSRTRHTVQIFLIESNKFPFTSLSFLFLLQTYFCIVSFFFVSYILKFIAEFHSFFYHGSVCFTIKVMIKIYLYSPQPLLSSPRMSFPWSDCLIFSK